MADILLFSSSDWDGLWGSRQQVALRLAGQGHRVLFVEQMAGWEHFWKYPDLRQRRRRHYRQGLRLHQPNLWLLAPPPLLPGRYYHPQIARWNAARLARYLRPFQRDLNFRQPLLWCYKPEQAFLSGRFSEQGLVYHCIDEFTVGTSGRKKAMIIQLEEKLLRAADVVFANSKLTFDAKRPFNPHTYRVPSGADIAHFSLAHDPQTVVHPDVAGLPTPIYMYVGSLNEKIDGALLTKVARAYPAASLVLIGQRLAGIDDAVWERHENMHWLGKRPFADLPRYLKAADLCLLPYVEGEATRYRSPLKLYEYLATGKPVLSTPHPEAAELAAVVTIAPTADWIEQLQQVLDRETPQAQQIRLQAAREHSWDKRVAVMLEKIEEISGIHSPLFLKEML